MYAQISVQSDRFVPPSAPPTAPGARCQTRCTPEQTPTGTFQADSPDPDKGLVLVFSSRFRSLGNAFQQEAILEIRQVLDEHNKRKRPVCLFSASGVERDLTPSVLP